MRPMKQALIFLILLLAGCSPSLSNFVAIQPTPFYTVGNTWAFRTLSRPYSTLPPNYSVMAVGYYEHWWVIETERGRFLIPELALKADYGEPHKFSDVAVYPHNYKPRGSYVGSNSSSAHAIETGPRGGEYYINGNGNRTYITPQTTYDREPVQTGPRGGQYYYNSNGRKTYIKR